MPNRSSIRTSVKKLLADHSFIDDSDINDIITVEHQEVLESFSWSQRKADTLINTVATYSTGTVSGTSGATTLTGSSTVWTSTMVNRFIRFGGTYFFKISSVDSATSLTLEDELADDVAASTSYTLFQHIYTLPSDFGRATNLTCDVRLTELPRSEIDRLDPYRSSTATRPDFYSIRGPNSSNVFEIEFWPVPSAANTIRVEYLKTNTLSSDTDSPLYPSEILVWKVAEAGAYFLHARSGDAAWLALADRYHARYLEVLDRAKEADIGRWSANAYIKDGSALGNLGDDHALSHDYLRLK